MPNLLPDQLDAKIGTDCCGQPIHHNSRKWEVRTNAHPNCNGTSWGWIEGTTKNICWSNDKSFNHSKALEVARLHNEWLTSQVKQ